MNRDSKDKVEKSGKEWVRPLIEWEEAYEPVVFAASCTVEAFNCGGGAHS